MTEHLPNLPASDALGSGDRLCHAGSPWRGGKRSSVRRVFHEAGPVAYYREGCAPLVCIHCGRKFESDSFGPVTDKTLTGAA